MTTHFTSGVTNVAGTTLLGRLKSPAPTKYHTYFNDFDTYVVGDWTLTTVEAGAGSASEALTNVDGGCLLITNDSADDDSDFFQKVGESFLWDSTKDMAFEMRFKVSDATQSDVVFGLQITDTTPLAVTDGIFFLKSDGSTTVNFLVEKNSTATTTAAGTLADDTFVKVGFFYDSVDKLFHIYWNDVEVATSVNTNAPDDEELTISFGIQNGEAVAKTMTVDYILAMKER